MLTGFEKQYRKIVGTLIFFYSLQIIVMIVELGKLIFGNTPALGASLGDEFTVVD